MADPTGRSARVVRDTATLFSSQLLIGTIGLISSAWLARHMSARELSLWPTCISIASVIYTMGNLGMRDATVRVIPRMIAEGSEEEAGTILRTGMLFALLATGLLVALTLIFVGPVIQFITHESIPTEVGRLLMVAVFLTVISQNFEWGLNAVQEYRTLALCRTLTNVLRPLAMMGLFVAIGPPGAILGLAVGPLASCFVSSTRLLRYFRWGRGLDPRQLFALSLPYYASGICSGLISRMDYILVGAIGGANSLATYFVAYKIAEVIYHLDSYAIDTTATKLAEKAVEGSAASSISFTKCTRYIFLGLLPVHMGVAAAGTSIIVLYAGQQYATAGVILSVLCFYLLAQVFYSIHRSHIIVLGGKWHPFLLDVLLALLMVISTTVLVARYGGLGAAMAGLLSVTVVVPVSMGLLRSVFKPIYDLPALFVGVLGGALFWALKPAIQALGGTGLWFEWAILPMGAIGYLLLLRHRLLPSDAVLLRALVPSRIAQRELGRRIERGMVRYFIRQESTGSSGNANVTPDV